MNFLLSKKRGVSTVISGAIFGVIFVSGFFAFITFMGSTSEFLNVQLETSEQEIDRVQEDFVIFASGNGKGGTFRVDVQNKGKTPVEIVDLWIVNRTGGVDCPPCDATVFPISHLDSFVPPNRIINILENSAPFSLRSGIYDLKVISALGNVEVFTLLRAGGTLLSSTLYANPPIVTIAGNTTLILNVINNSTEVIYNVTASEPSVVPITAIAEGGVVQNDPVSIQKLEPNESFDFTWNYKLLGASGTRVQFSTNAAGHKQLNSNSTEIESLVSNTVTATVKLKQAISTTVTTSGAAADIFLVIPSPVGKSEDINSKGFWGMILVNPTNQTMFVHRVEIGAHSNRQNSDKIFDEKFGTDEHVQHIEPCCIVCDTDTLEDIAGNLTYLDSDPDPDDVTPNFPLCLGSTNPPDQISNDNYTQIPDGKSDPIGRWDVPRDNNLVWTGNVTYPMMIPPFRAQEFIVKMSSEADGDISAFIVAANAQTSFGLISNIGHASSARQLTTSTTIVNVYPTASVRTGTGNQPDSGCYTDNPPTCSFDDPASRYPDDDFQGVQVTTAGQTVPFYVTIREGQAGISNAPHIDGVSDCNADLAIAENLIINLPPGFPDVSFTVSQAGFCDAELVTFSDGSKQIRAIINDDIGESTTEHVERRTFTFSTTTPDVEATTIYVFFAYVDGFDVNQSTKPNPLGPISEAVVLIVEP